MKKLLFLTIVLLAATAVLSGCQPSAQPASTATPQLATAPVPTPVITAAPTEETISGTETAAIITSKYTGYYLTGWELRFDGGLVYADDPGGTGTESVDMYLQRDGEQPILLSECMAAFKYAYLSGQYLYFSYSDDDSVYDAVARININSPEKTELLGTYHLKATSTHFYYYKEQHGDDLYRCDANYENEELIIAAIGYKWNMLFADEYIIDFIGNSFDKTALNSYVVYKASGELAYEYAIEKPMAWSFTESGGVLYWCDNALAGENVTLNMLDLSTGRVSRVVGDLDDFMGECIGIAKAEEGFAYIRFSYWNESDIATSFENTYLYKMPIDGGTLEFVDKWFES